MPLLFCPVAGLPASDPGHIAAECVTKILGGIVNRKLVDFRPQLDLVAFVVALMAVVPPGVQIHRERSAVRGVRLVDGTRTTPLISRSAGWLETDQVQDLLHRDLVTKLVEVDSGHDLLPFWWAGWKQDRSVPSYI